jgi:sulfoxide reductase heme-binding subunit YedZ
VLIGPSFYLRRRIGAARWRKIHRVAFVIWILSVVHTIGAGSDGSKLWLRAIVFAPVVPIVYLLVTRALRPATARPATAPRSRSERSGPRGLAMRH